MNSYLLEVNVLVALAMHHQGKLATLDRGIAQFAPAQALEIIP